MVNQIGASGALAPFGLGRPDDPNPWGDKLGALRALQEKVRQQDFTNNFISTAMPDQEALEETLHQAGRVAEDTGGVSDVQRRLNRIKQSLGGANRMSPNELAAAHSSY